MNKLIIILTVTLTLAAATVNAQFYKGFGFKAGVSIANQMSEYNNLSSPSLSFTNNSDNVYWHDYKAGFTAGIFKEVNIAQNIKTQIGINYSRKGYLQKIYTNFESSQYYYFHHNLDFITAELYGKYNFLNSKINPYILAGLRMDFYLTKNSFYRTPNGDEDSKYGTEITNYNILGASLGLGIDFPASKLLTVFLECTFNPDLIYISNVDIYYRTYYYYNGYENMSESHYNNRSRNQSFDIRTGIKF
jgi:hypothetical protein